MNSRVQKMIITHIVGHHYKYFIKEGDLYITIPVAGVDRSLDDHLKVENLTHCYQLMGY